MSKEQVGRLDLNLVLVFDALLRHQNVTRAAAALNVTQSAVSHALRRLRGFFDDTLFVRVPAGIVPTSRAAELAATVVEIASLVRQGLLNEASFTPETSQRMVTICLSDLGESAILPTLMSKLRGRSPGCTLRTVQAEPNEAHALLKTGAVDIAIGALSPGQSDIYRQKLFTQSAIVLAHESTLGTKPFDLDTYCELPQVAIAPAFGHPSIVDDALRRIGRQRKIVLTTQHHLVIPYLIADEPTLIATVPRTLAHVCRHHFALKALPLPFEFPEFEVFQYWHARFHTDRFHTWFRSLVAESFQGAPP